MQMKHSECENEDDGGYVVCSRKSVVVGHTQETNERRKHKSAAPWWKRMFKGPAWIGGYANFELAILAVLPFRSSSFSGAGSSAERERRQKAAKRLRCFLRYYALMSLAQYILLKQKEITVMQMPSPGKPPKGFDPANPRHRAVGAAMEITQRRGGNMERFERVWRRGTGFLKEHGLDTKNQSRVQCSLALLGSEHSDLSECDLRVLLAVNSCCGKKAWGQVSLEAIARRAVGAEDEHMLRKLGVEPLSRKQVERAISKLARKRLIYFVTWHHRICYAGNPGIISKATFEGNVANAVRDRVKNKKAAGSILKVEVEKDGKVSFQQHLGNRVYKEVRSISYTAEDDF
jgi:hypothetical protein